MDTLNKLFSNVHPKRFAPILSVDSSEIIDNEQDVHESIITEDLGL